MHIRPTPSLPPAVAGSSGNSVPVPAGQAAPRAWPPTLAVLAAGLAALLLVFHDTVTATAHTWWTTSSYNHGMVIPLVCLWLAWDRREALRQVMPRGSVAGLVLMAAAALVWTLGALVSLVILQQAALVGMIWGMVLAGLGWPAVRLLIFPLGYLVFAVPFGEELVPRLQAVTAELTVWLLRASGVPTYSDGIFIQTAFGAFEVAEACAGLRFLIACVAFGTLYAGMFYRSWTRRVVFVLACIGVPIIANGIRAYGIVMLSDLIGPEVAGDVDHLIYGWIFFSVVMGILALGGWPFRQTPATSGDDGSDDTGGRTGGARGAAAGVAAALAVAVVLPGWLGPGAAVAGGPIHAPLALAAPPGWEAAAVPDDWTPAFPGAQQVVAESFTAAGARVERVVAWFPEQGQGREAVGHDNDLTDGWRRLATGRQGITIEDMPVQAHVMRLDRTEAPAGRRLVWSWYWVDGTFTGDPRIAKLLQVRGLLLRGSGAAAVVAVSAVADGPAGEARALGALRGFVTAQRDLSSTLVAAAAGSTDPAVAQR